MGKQAASRKPQATSPNAADCQSGMHVALKLFSSWPLMVCASSEPALGCQLSAAPGTQLSRPSLCGLLTQARGQLTLEERFSSMASLSSICAAV